MSAVAAPAAVMIPAPRRPADDAAVEVLPELYVPEAEQWLSTSTGRVAPDGYSWLQGVHWVAGAGLYEPRRHRSHGPRSFGPTTVYVARLLAELSPCRPGIEYLMRRTGLSERSVEYHLQMLRETGLLVWELRGTRVRGERAQASVYVRMLPWAFDAALGIRTVLRDQDAPAYTRAVTGIGEAGRELMARLGRKAARKARRPKRALRTWAKASGGRSCSQPRGPVAQGTRCTPMGGGSSTGSSAADTCIPPESKLGCGDSKSTASRKSTAKADGRRKLNTVGRRFQLARELTEELDWLRGCSVPRIAWVARHVADAGWTVTDIKGWLHLRGEAVRVRRGSGLLAILLAEAPNILNTPEKRAAAVEQWRGAQEARRRHRIQQVRARTEWYEGGWEAPTSRAVQLEVEAAFAQVRETATGGRHQDQQDAADDQDAGLELSEQEVADLRATARGEFMRGETTLVTSTVDMFGRPAAKRIYGPDLVQRALRLASGSRSSLMALGHR
ncbi:transcriptional regulator [Streptomyces sp. NPDC055709]